MPITTDEEIQLRAYQIWKEEGRPEDRDKEHWQQASDEVMIARGDARAAAADADLAHDPGIGSSAGTTGFDPLDDKGTNTFEGDVLSDVTGTGGVDPNQRGRTNE